MKLRTLAVCLLFAGVCSAKEHDYQKGTLLRMDSSSCGTQEKGSKTVAGEIFGTDGQHKQTQEMLCQEYVLQSDHVIYRIRPKDEKHPVLLPIGETAQFRINKTGMTHDHAAVRQTVEEAREQRREIGRIVEFVSAGEGRIGV